jgi:hypothetical protein
MIHDDTEWLQAQLHDPSLCDIMISLEQEGSVKTLHNHRVHSS